MLKNKNILLIISGGIAAYKSLELIRLLKKQEANVKTILTKAGSEFITALSVSSLSGEQCYTDLFSLKDETEMGHIKLSREADLIIIAPASANIIAKMANGIADDLATTTLLASNKQIIIAPAMNHAMWKNPATQSNLSKLRQYGIKNIGPEKGDMACGENGIGRMSDPETIIGEIEKYFSPKPLKGKHIIVTSGPTYEPIDPVRFIGNRSSGKQGQAIAKSLRDAGAKITLITGPISLNDLTGVTTIHVETATEMLEAVNESLPADVAICAAAVSDWRIENSSEQKIKKQSGKKPVIKLNENPDILYEISNNKNNRPPLVIGFAAETENLIENAKSKLKKKKCDVILANDVSPSQKIFSGNENQLYFITESENEKWKRCSKQETADKITDKVISFFKKEEKEKCKI